MANQPVVRSKRIINPMFFIPEGMVGYEYEELQDFITEDAINDDAEVVLDDSMLMEDSVDEETDTPSVPTGITIVSQTPRSAADGTTVIDVVLNVEDEIGVSKYDVRITKI